jgi:hypothetical protein
MSTDAPPISAPSASLPDVVSNKENFFVVNYVFLCKHEEAVLSNGPKFIPNPKTKDAKK